MRDPKPEHYIHSGMPTSVIAGIYASFCRPTAVDQLVSEIKKAPPKKTKRKAKKP